MNYTKQKDFDLLIKKFLDISELRYVKGVTNNLNNSCGLTFESLLGKKADSSYLPDFNGIEIKCKQRYSKQKISLFSLSFEGPEKYESNSILQKYGSYDYDYPDRKKLYTSLRYKTKILIDENYFFELDIDHNKRMLFVNIYDSNDNFIEKRCYISFDRLEERINTKLKKLALVRASKKVINGNLFFRYYKITCYTFKNFETFIKMIEEGYIKLSIVLRFSKTDYQTGSNKNKNMLFSIDEEDLEKIYNNLFTYQN